MTELSIVVAYSRNRVIGKDNQLPWRLPGDLAHFKRQTLGKPIIMGRKTWQSIGRPLPGRTNVVISRSGDADFSGAEQVSSLEQALELVAAHPQACIIGGADLYRQTIALASRILATEVHTEIEGDAYFPVLDMHEWVQFNRQSQAPENGLAYDFVQYIRQPMTT
jgi:dihydrofolate reductase